MCGGCNIWAESAGVSLIFARYWWVARQGRRAVAEAERVTQQAPVAGADRADSDWAAADGAGFVDPMPELTRALR